MNSPTRTKLKAYQDAFAYVQKNHISWVQFRKITGRVEDADLFHENLWTPQFKEIFAMASGIIFTGGMDIPPAAIQPGGQSAFRTDDPGALLV